jgi:alternate signal-mediated exported protein
MNKLVKGSAVGGAGVVLMLGGFGTYALWSDSDTVQNKTVTSGELDISANPATWQDVSAAGPNNWTYGDLVVPGDTLRMTQTFNVKATGKNMKGTLSFTPGATDTSAFGGRLSITPTVTAGSGLDVVTPGRQWSFSAPVGTTTVTATVTYVFDAATSQQAAQNALASIADSTFNLDQAR